MPADEKKQEWQVIADARRRAQADLTAKLKAARLARDAALPPPEPVKPRTRKPKATK